MSSKVPLATIAGRPSRVMREARENPAQRLRKSWEADAVRTRRVPRPFPARTPARARPQRATPAARSAAAIRSGAVHAVADEILDDRRVREGRGIAERVVLVGGD